MSHHHDARPLVMMSAHIEAVHLAKIWEKMLYYEIGSWWLALGRGLQRGLNQWP